MGFNSGSKGLSTSCWSRGLRRGSVPTRLLGLRFRIPPEAWMSVAFECYVLSCRGLCDGPITRLEESYRVLCLNVISEPRQGEVDSRRLSNYKKKLRII